MKMLKKILIANLVSCFSRSKSQKTTVFSAIFGVSPLFILSISSIFLSFTGCAGTSSQAGRANTESGTKSSTVLPWQSGNLKIGYIRSDIINRDYPEYRDADNELLNQNRKWMQEADQLEREILKKEREHEELALILSEEKRLEIETEIASMRKKLQKFKNDTWYDDNSSYIQRRREVMEPIDSRVNDAIWKVSAIKDLDMVFDTIAGNVVYVKPSLDITEDVLEELAR